jgi:hypothetical protein
MGQFYLTQYRNPDNLKPHPNLNCLQTREFSFHSDGSIYLIRLENQLSGLNKINQLDYVCLSIPNNQLAKQNVELQLDRGRLIYTKSSVFGLSYSMKLQANSKEVKISPLFKPRGDQVKSSNYNIEHPPVILGQWNPSSSKDG